MDLREHTPVGTPHAEVKTQLQAGYEAQGWALAQSIIGLQVSLAKDMSRACIQAFQLSQAARGECMAALNRWKKTCREAAENNGNLAEWEIKDRRKIASSANTRVSEFGAVIKAMDAGMTLTTLANQAGVADPENMSFHTIVQIARLFTPAVAGAGRPADPFAVRLQKWLDRQAEDADKARVVAVLEKAHLLPEPVPEQPATEAVASTRKPVARKIVVPAPDVSVH